MFEKLKRRLQALARSIKEEASAPEDAPESFDHPRPKRNNPDPPKRDWFARVRDRSYEARAGSKADASLLDHDEEEPALSRDASRQVDELLAKTGVAPRRGR
jgi:hypothetical protein